MQRTYGSCRIFKNILRNLKNSKNFEKFEKYLEFLSTFLKLRVPAGIDVGFRVISGSTRFKILGFRVVRVVRISGRVVG